MKDEYLSVSINLLYPPATGKAGYDNADAISYESTPASKTEPFKQMSIEPIISESVLKDLDIELNVENDGYVHFIHLRPLLEHITSDYDVIKYRQDVIDELMCDEALFDDLERFYKISAELAAGEKSEKQTALKLALVADKCTSYVKCMIGLYNSLNGSKYNVKSQGLINLGKTIGDMINDPSFKQFEHNIKVLASSLLNPRSLLLGINFNDRMQPAEATLLSVDTMEYNPPITAFDRLLKKFRIKKDFTGISLVHVTRNKKIYGYLRARRKYEEEDNGIARGAVAFASKSNDLKASLINPFNSNLELLEREYSGSQIALEKGLKDISNLVISPLCESLEKYINQKLDFLKTLNSELYYYLEGVRFLKKLQASGIPMCKPEIRPMYEKAFTVAGLCNINLALKLQNRYQSSNISRLITYNDARFDDTGRAFILTGPNSGGKTTYLQAIGQAQLLFQLGLYVPGTKACISPVESIFTHFPAEEQDCEGMGRLGEECSRIADIFKHATQNSLILMNESLTSTNPKESIYIAKNIITGLKLLGANSVFVTHYRELAYDIDELNSSVSGTGTITSLVSGSQQKYEVKRSPPLESSYAIEMASRYGLTVEKLAARLGSKI